MKMFKIPCPFNIYMTESNIQNCIIHTVATRSVTPLSHWVFRFFVRKLKSSIQTSKAFFERVVLIIFYKFLSERKRHCHWKLKSHPFQHSGVHSLIVLSQVTVFYKTTSHSTCLFFKKSSIINNDCFYAATWLAFQDLGRFIDFFNFFFFIK